MYGEGDVARPFGGPEDYRLAFGRDRDRVLYSSAFRRLAGKTQVVAVGELGDFHTRMTHSLKVAQLGRRLAQKLAARAEDRGVVPQGADYPTPDPELVEAACLAHDLGHPPFGHAGEAALQAAVDRLAASLRPGPADPRLTAAEAVAAAHFEAQLGVGGFEGNAQTFRILVRLSARHPEESRGLNLTRATLDATVKYPWSRGSEGLAQRKWNAYPGDLDVALWVRGDAGWDPDASKSMEARMMDWCDDVTYACHDVEDFFRAGLIPLEALFAFPDVGPDGEPEEDDEPDELRTFLDYLTWKWEGERSRDELRAAWKDLQQYVAITTPYRADRASKAAVHATTSSLITHFLDNVDWAPIGAPPTRYHAVLAIPELVRLQCDMLQQLIWHYVIGRPALASQQAGQQRIIGELLEAYVFGDERLLPDDRREELQEHGDLIRVATDHVASLTEATAQALYRRFMGVETGLHSDPVWFA